jgi:urease accessory protein
MKKSFSLTMLAFLMASPLIANAHVLPNEGTSFSTGLHHPLHGLDHLLAMVAVGLWAVQMGRKSIYWIPLSFVTVMALGGMIGFTGIHIPWMEQGIIASVLILGMLIAGTIRLPTKAAMALVAVFALFHGYAHGVEMSANFHTLSYSAGFLLSTVLLHLTGIIVAGLAKQYRFDALIRYAGVCTLIAGFVLCF